MIKPGIQRVQALADISHSELCYHSNETHAPIANLPYSAQLGIATTISPSYIQVRALASECGEGQTDTHRHTDGRDQYTFCLGYASHKM